MHGSVADTTDATHPVGLKPPPCPGAMPGNGSSIGSGLRSALTLSRILNFRSLMSKLYAKSPSVLAKKPCIQAASRLCWRASRLTCNPRADLGLRVEEIISYIELRMQRRCGRTSFQPR